MNRCGPTARCKVTVPSPDHRVCAGLPWQRPVWPARPQHVTSGRNVAQRAIRARTRGPFATPTQRARTSVVGSSDSGLEISAAAASTARDRSSGLAHKSALNRPETHSPSSRPQGGRHRFAREADQRQAGHGPAVLLRCWTHLPAPTLATRCPSISLPASPHQRSATRPRQRLHPAAPATPRATARKHWRMTPATDCKEAGRTRSSCAVSATPPGRHQPDPTSPHTPTARGDPAPEAR